MIRKTLHDEQHNEDFYYESERGNIWHEVEMEDTFSKCSVCGHGMIVSPNEQCPICGKSEWIEI